MKPLRPSLVLWILLLSFSAPLSAPAQEATPAPWSQAVKDSFVAGASRDFQAIGTRSFGIAYFSIAAYLFDSTDIAKQAMGESLTRLPELPGAGVIQPASVGELGDEIQAYLTTIDAEDAEYSVGLIFWRDGATVYFGMAAAASGNPLTELVDIGEAITGRPYVDTPVVTPVLATGMRTGGIWDFLPALSDIPEGFVFVQEKEIDLAGAATPTS